MGVTSNLLKRVYEHRSGLADGFTRCYGVHDLVWYEVHAGMESAILREKQLKEMVPYGKDPTDRTVEFELT